MLIFLPLVLATYLGKEIRCYTLPGNWLSLLIVDNTIALMIPDRFLSFEPPFRGTFLRLQAVIWLVPAGVLIYMLYFREPLKNAPLSY